MDLLFPIQPFVASTSQFPLATANLPECLPTVDFCELEITMRLVLSGTEVGKCVVLCLACAVSPTSDI